MRRTRMIAITGALALAAAALGGAGSASARTPAAAAAATGKAADYVVLAKAGTDVHALARQLRATGATVTSVNTAVGMVRVTSTSSRFLDRARSLGSTQVAARDGVVGRAPKDTKVRPSPVERGVEQPGSGARQSRPSVKRSAPTQGRAANEDPLDDYLWGMDMIKAPRAHRIEMGDRRVRVGVIDTGIDAGHPDLARNFDFRLSRNFTTDIPEVDGPCEFAGCKDPATVDDGGHGTHVAGTIAAAMNGVGVSGVAPTVDLVNLRAGQDSGYFFLAPTVDALTYAGDHGIDVVNMSFYVDPWLYNCAGGAPEDTTEQAAEQDAIILAMRRALRYAHSKQVTLVAALGNEHSDLANPFADNSSPDYPGGTEHPRTIANATCWSMPTEGPYVLGVSALGPSGKKSDFSNYTTDLASREIEVSAPGGWFRDGFGTDTYRTNENLILSAAPKHVLQAEGSVDAKGNITPDGVALGVMKDCTRKPVTPDADRCGYYQWLQGTSMASPHATGVVALAVSAHGRVMGRSGFGMSPNAVRRLVMSTATNHACPAGGVQSYTNEGRSEEFTAKCVGTSSFNGFYGDGIVNAYGVVR